MKTAQPTRRSFLKSSLATAAATTLLRNAHAEIPGITYGVQLYMLRRQAMTDLPGVFKIIHDAGYAQVELYPIAYRYSASELRGMIAAAGIGAVSGHFDYDGLLDKVDYARDLGLKFMVCPMLPQDQWTSLEGFEKAATLFNKVGEKAASRGMEFVFHNHDYEFRTIRGATGFRHLMALTDRHLVKLELDMYWLTQAGQDPLAMLKEQADRVRLIHLKDRTAGAPTSFDMDKPSEHFIELGKGTINWPAIIRQARAQGIEYAFMDQDETALPIPESLRISRAYLRSL